MRPLKRDGATPWEEPNRQRWSPTGPAGALDTLIALGLSLIVRLHPTGN